MKAMQLDLWEAEIDALPWRGVSPRGLTRGYLALFLRRKPQKDARFYLGPEQYKFRLVGEKAPWKYQGAPLLKKVE